MPLESGVLPVTPRGIVPCLRPLASEPGRESSYPEPQAGSIQTNNPLCRDPCHETASSRRPQTWSKALRVPPIYGAGMTREEFRARWNARLTECVKLGILVDGERFCREVLADFEALISAEDDRVL